MINGITYTEVEIQSAVPHLDTAQFSKLQEALTVLCWYFFDLTEITILKKENISPILLAKIYENNFSKGMFNEAETICLNMKRYSK